MQEAPIRSIFDYTEQRFPLNLKPQLEDIRSLWDLSNKLAWDPNTAIPWEQFDKSKYSQEQLDAARLYWSRRAWTEYTGTAESPAVLLRLIMEPGHDIDSKLFWSVQTLEETRHCIASYLFAEKLGGYHAAPPTQAPKSTHHRGIRDKVLDPAISFDAFVLAHICIGETIAAKMFEERYRAATDPVAKELVRLILRDESRHIQYGWKYMAHRVKSLTPEGIQQIEQVATDVMENSELKGFHCIWLVPQPHTQPLIDASNITAEAGLGGAAADDELRALVEGVREIREKMKPWGVNIPVFDHPILGEV